MMRILIACILSLAVPLVSLASAPTPTTQPATPPPPRAARSVHLFYRVAHPADAFYNEVTVERSTAGSYFMACGFRHGYFGIQELAKGRKVVLFSVWDAPASGDAEPVPLDRRVEILQQGEGVQVKRFGGEGTGAQCLFPYDWKLGQACRFFVRATVDGERTAYAAYFWIPDDNRWKRLATFRTRTSGDRLEELYSFVEDFRRDGRSAGDVRRAKFGNAWVSVKGQPWTPLIQARFTASSSQWEARESIDAGAAGGRFYLQTGGDTTTSKALNSLIECPAGSHAPSDLPDQ